MKENEIVSLSSYYSIEEANIAASLLRSMGVEVQVVGEIAANVLPYLAGSNVVRLLVKASDYDRAVSLLENGPEEQ